jgi:hypothetical protein
MLKKFKSAIGGSTRTLMSLLLLFVVATGLLIRTSANADAYLPPVPPNNISDKFIIGAMESARDRNQQYVDELGLNLWHHYTAFETHGQKNYPTGWVYNNAPNDLMFATIQEYGQQVRDVLTNIYTLHNGMRALMMRPKIDYLCYGQRSDYQCEDTNFVDKGVWFYAFNEHGQYESIPDITQYGNGQYVVHCIPSSNPPGYVVRRLKANTEQCNRMVHSTTSGNQWHGDSECDWIIKPSVRVDRDFVLNINNQETPIFNIKVYSQNGTSLMKDVDVKAKYFLNSEGQYDGKYLEEFNFANDPYNLIINGDWGDWWWYGARGNKADDNWCNKADIQVYWYGNCDMWLDYVRVDNDIADMLLNPNNQYYARSQQWIHDEANYIACYGDAPLKYYSEIVEFNNIPCIGYVNKKLNLYCSKKVTFMTPFVYTFYSAHTPWQDRDRILTPEHIKRFFIDSTGCNELFWASYPFTSLPEDPAVSTFSKIPNTLPVHSGSNLGILAIAVPPTEYEDWLQENLDRYPYYADPSYPEYPWTEQQTQMAGDFRWNSQIANQISKRYNIPLLYFGQAHINFNVGSETEREPTNEELEMTSCVAISYGAKGIIYYKYPGDGTIGNSENESYDVGFMDPLKVPPYVAPRLLNVYREHKWEKSKELFQKFNIWGPTLMNFDNTQTNSYIYQLESDRYALTNPQKSYFKDVITYRPGTLQPSCPLNPGFDSPPNMIYDCEEFRFVQVATFKSNMGNPDAKYFMIVNRRCSPYIDELSDDHHGGKRDICLVFWANHPAFDAANSWDIIDLGNPMAQHIQFDKRYEQLINLGRDFDPGEGRLYKIVPTAQHGGNLICDENITGQEFTCLDAVYNNEHNITIGSGTTIHFTDSSKIIMNEGTFQLGDPNNNGPCNISIGAASGSHWTGFDFNNCNVKV